MPDKSNGEASRPRDTSERVRTLYERFPYPSPRDDLVAIAQGHVLELGYPRWFFHKYWPRQGYREDLDILVAGCGTVQAARYAAAHPGARVTGVDVSEASLNHSRDLAERHGLQNLELARLPVEGAAELGRDFDLIVSTGVIHHLPEPATGLAALRKVLREDGRVYLMLYAPHGRDAIYYLQALMEQLGVNSADITEEELDQLRRLVESLPREHPIWHRRRQFPDLSQPAELVDYLLHPQDRPYTLAQCRELLESCGLLLQDVFNRAHYSPRCSPLGRSSLYRSTDADGEWRAFDLGEQYRAALTRHDLIACHQNCPAGEQHISLDEDWTTVVPHRMPGVQTEPTTGGAAAQLRWPTHAFNDIRLALTREELSLFKSIDGKRTLAELLRHVTEAHGMDRGAVQALAEKLIDYDYVCLSRT